MVDVLSNTSLQAKDIALGELDENVMAVLGLTRWRINGHSLAIGGGSTGEERDATTHTASALGGSVLEINNSVGGAIAGRDNNPVYGTTGNGGYATVLQHNVPKTRVFSTISVVTDNKQFTTNAPTNGAWKQGMCIAIRLAATGNIYTRFVSNAVGVGNVILIDEVLPANPAVGDRVWEIPPEYQSAAPAFLAWYGNNDFGYQGMGDLTTPTVGAGGSVGHGKRAVINALRSIVAMDLCAEFFDANHTSVVPGGGAAAAGALGTRYGRPFAIGALANGHTIDCYVPANVEGGAVYLFFIAMHGAAGQQGGGTATFTVNGSDPGVGALEARYGIHFEASVVYANCFVKRIPISPNATGNTVRATIANAGVNFYFLGFGIESYPSPPLVHIPGPIRARDYSLYGSATYTELTGTINAAMNSTGLTSATITPAQRHDIYGTGTNQILKAGEPFTFNPGGAQQETLTIAADVAAGGTTVTFTSGTTKTHSVGEVYHAQMHDKAIRDAQQWWIDLAAEFATVGGAARENPVVYVDVDAALHGGTALASKDPSVSSYDHAHPNDKGHSRVSRVLRAAIHAAKALLYGMTSRLAVPTAPLPEPAVFIAAQGTAQVGTAPGGAGAMSDAFPNRYVSVDLRKVREARLQATVVSGNIPGGIGHVEYSVDNGTTWKTLGRLEDNSNVGNTSLTQPGQVDLSVAGRPISYGERGQTEGWFYLPGEVRWYAAVLIRYVHGNRTSGTNNPVYSGCQVGWR